MVSTSAQSTVIRPYTLADRSAVRDLCYATADRGRPLAFLSPDREIVADVLTRYYTDWEPESTWVAHVDGQVVGYLTGSVDTLRCQRVMRARVVPDVLGRAFLHGALVRRSTWQLMRAAWMTWHQGGFHRFRPPRAYPAHFHVNVQDAFRGAHIGQKLVEQFLAHAAAAGVFGVHLSTREDNARACRFFERLGFRPLSRYPVVLPEQGRYQRHYTVVYAKAL